MEQRKIFGLCGAGLLMLGCFAPLVSIPLAGAMTYVQGGRGDGMIVLALAIIAALGTLVGLYRGVLLAGIGAAATIAFTFYQFQKKMAEVRADLGGTLADNPFRGLAEAAVQSVQLQWAWAPLLMGAILLIAAGLIAGQRRQPCPYCGESMTVDAPECAACGKGVTWFKGKPRRRSRLADGETGA